MALNITLDMGEVIRINNEIDLEYVGKIGRKIKLRFVAEKTIPIKRIKQNQPEIIRKPALEKKL